MDSDRFPPEAATVAAGRSTPSASARRFAPGAIIGGRYRLVALLGRGGMGEVYRADDLVLDQPVALKFLPEAVVGDAAHLTQFHNELRTARQVSHKNVVRLYDLGEAEGRPFLTMEYVDGEDLASLLRRIGRFPQDKAIDVARQLCAGVAAAHERGVIHRDLKPSNVMLDGDGNVRITDFGIATAAVDAGADIAGTPQYMAPELLRGAPASIRTDLYALGLVLFEIFTGRRVFEAASLAQLRALHDTTPVLTPSSIVRDLDPAIERVILRAIDRDDTRRPGSALAIAAALPGGNPLAEALAAGETPSPDMVAAAGESEAIGVGRGLLLVAALASAIAVYALLSPPVTLADLAPLDKPPAVLADRAQQLLASLGYDEKPTDTADNFALGGDFARWLVQHDASANRWNPAQVALGPAVLYWYRTSPDDLQPLRPASVVAPGDPPLTVSGMSVVTFDSAGRLQEFQRVPPEHDPPQLGAPAPSWNVLFDAAGLSMDRFSPAEPEWTPHDFADVRMAWTGPHPMRPDIELRVEAAAYRGRIVSFDLVGPWARPRDQQRAPQSGLNHALSVFSTLFWMSLLAGATLLARANLRDNRADRRTAARLALTVIALEIASWVVAGHHALSPGAEFNAFTKLLSNALLAGGILWVLYLAMEPYGRRFWPDGLIGWTRLWSGRVRDSRIGREILIGCALGGGLMLIDLLRAGAPRLLGRPSGVPSLGFDVAALAGTAHLIGSWSQQIYNSVQTALLITMVFVVLRLIVRRTWVAATIGLAITTAAAGASMPAGDVLWLNAVAQVAAVGLIVLAIFRFGLLVTVVTLCVDNIPTAVPVAPHAAWAATAGNLSMALVLALACFGYYAARAGQPVFGSLKAEV